MEWEWEVKINLLFFALLRRKDRFYKEGERRWALAVREHDHNDVSYWEII